MCADNSSDRQYDGRGRHRRPGASQQIHDNIAQLAATPHAVGRVGALAVALGIGGAILGFTPVAAADAGDTTGPGQDSGRSADTAQRRGGSTASSNAGSTNAGASNAESSNAEAPARSSRSGRAARSARGSGAAESGPAVDSAQARKAEPPTRAAAITQAPAAAESAPASTPESAPVIIEEAPAATAPVTRDVGPGVSGDGAVPAGVVVAPVGIAPVVEEAPVITAAASGVLAEGDSDPTALLGEDGTGEPGAEPLAWAALAVSRREDLAGATPEVAPAASVGTAAGVDAAGRVLVITGFSPSSGVVGTEITINGSGFLNDQGKFPVNEVFFGCGASSCPSGAVKVAPKSVTTTQIVVVVPAGAQSGNIKINATGTGTPPAVYTSTPFTVISVPSPSIASISPGNGSVGDKITITGSNFKDASSVKFGCNAKCTNGVTAAYDVNPDGDKITATVPTGATTGLIQVVAPGGSVISTSSFTVNPPPSITTVNPSSGFVNDQITISGQYLANATSVKFNCASSTNCKSAVEAQFTQDNVSQVITATVPTGAVTNYIQVAAPAGTATSGSKFTVNAPANVAFTPDSGKPGTTVTITGTYLGNATSVDFNGAPATFEQDTQTLEITATVPDAATTGKISVTTPSGVAKSDTNFTVVPTNYVPLPPLPKCSSQACETLTFRVGPLDTRVQIINAISDAVAKALPSAGPSTQQCTSGGCPINGYGGTTASVADTIGMYGFNIIYALAGGKYGVTPDAPTPEVVGQQVVDLVTQPNVLSFISDTVSTKLSTGTETTAGLPVDVADSIGNAAATFVQNSFGNLEVATALVPFLYSLNVPTTDAEMGVFIKTVQGPPISINRGLLSTFNPDQGQAALIEFFSDPTVQNLLGPGITGEFPVPGAFSSAVNVMLGLAQPTWEGAEDVPPTAVADALGQLVANRLLPEDNPDNPALAATISGTVENLITAIGPIVANDAGQAFVDLLNAPVDPTAPTLLANYTVDAFVTFLWGAGAVFDLPFPNPPLLPALADAAGYAASDFVGSLLSDSDVLQGLGTFLTDLVPEVFANQGVQEEISAKITGLLGPGLGDTVANTVLGLLTDTTVTGALTTFVNTTVGSFLGSFGVVAALSDAAGALTTAQLNGTIKDVRPQVIADLKVNTFIDDGVAAGVTAGSAGLLRNTEFWDAINNSVASLVSTLLTDPTAQSGLAQLVSDQVAKSFKSPAIGQFVGDQVGTLVVEILTNPVVEQGLYGVVDTLIADFWQSPGVVDAFSVAFGTLAAAQLAGNYADVYPEVLASLQANQQVDDALAGSFEAAMTAFLGDSNLWSAVDGTISAAVIELTTDPTALGLLNQAVQAAVTERVGEPLAGVIAPQIADAVVSLVSNPAVAPALLGVVDTLVADFFGTAGVVDAFAGAAGTWALVLFTTFNPSRARELAQQQLRFSDAVATGVDVAVTGAVAELLGDTGLWAAVDQTVSSLAVTLLGDVEVQQAIQQQVADQVELRFTGDLGVFLGEQLGNLVVALVTNPTIQTGLLGVVDTLAVDFWSTPGVVTAFSEAAGALAYGWLTGDPNATPEAVQADLRANPDVQAGVQNSVGDAVTELLSNTAMWAEVGQILSAAVLNLTTNPVVLDGLNNAIASQIQISLGEPLGSVVGPQIADAVVSLVSNPAVVPALLGVVDTLVADFFGTNGVVGAFSAAASEFALILVTGGDRSEASKAAQAVLKDSPAVATGVDASVTAAVAELLSDTALWGAVDQTVSSLAVTLLGDAAVQQALHDRVADAVELRITGDLGVFVGDQLGNLVVALVTNPVIQTGLLGVFDTLVSDFWSTPGVVTAFSEAAGALAYGALTGDPDATPEKVRADLQADPAVQAGVQRSVGAAVTELLSDSSLWSAVGGTLSAAVINLTSNPVVLDALGNAVSTQVQIALGDPLGGVVGPQIGAAVVQLVSDPAVVPALLGLVDTLFADFFGAPGVVDSFSTAASQLALVLLTGGSLAEAEKAARQILKDSPAVDDGVDVAVTGAVAELLSDTGLWAAVDQTVSSLVVTLLGDVAVQDALGAAVAALVESNIDGELGQVVGAAVGDAVVSLVTNPDVQAGVYGVVDTLFVDFWTSPGVVTAFSEAAGALAKGALIGDPDAMKNVKEALQSNPDVDAAVDVSVTAAVSELLSDTKLWVALDSTLSSLVGGLLDNPVVDDSIYQAVFAAVEKSLKAFPQLAAVIAPQVATAVVSLVTNSDIQAGVSAAVNTLFSGFFGAPGVIEAISGAAGSVAKAVFTGDPFKDALKTATEELQANGEVDAAVEGSVAGVVTELLSDGPLWAALDSTLSTLVAGLLGEPLIQQSIAGFVSALVETEVKGPAGPVVGARVGAAVVSLLTSPAIQTGVHSLVDTLFSDFFGSSGVAEAFGVAAGDLALVAFVGGDPSAELPTVIQALRIDADVDAGVDFAVSAGVSQLLSDTAVWATLDSTLSALVAGLVTDPVVAQAIYDTVDSNIEKALGGELGAEVGPQVATAVLALLSSPALAGGLHDLVDTLFSDFFGADGVIAVLSDTAGQIASDYVSYNTDAIPDVVESVRTNPDIDGAVYGSVSAGVSQLLSDADLWRSLDTIFSNLVGGLLSGPAVQAAVEEQISDTVATAVGGGDLGAVVGPQVATAVIALITDPAIGAALNTLTTTLFYDFFSAEGVIPVLSDAAGTLAEAFVYGNLDEVQPEVIWSVRGNPDIDAAVDGSVSSAFTAFFATTDVAEAVGTQITTLVTDLLGDTVVQDAAGNAVAALVTGYLGSSPIAGPVGQAVGVAVEQFLDTTGVPADLGAIIGGLIPDFLGQTGVPDGLGSALGAFAVALVRGDDRQDATQIALDDLKANPDVVAAVKVTIADALNEVDTTMLSDPTIQQSLGLITTDLIVSLAGNAQVQAYVATTYGAPVAALLTNQAVVDEIADQLGLAVTELLAYPGVSTAITDSLDLFADEVIDGTKQTVALGDALTFLQTNAAFVAGVNAVIPNTVNTILADPAVLAAVEVLAQQEAIAAMQSFGIKIKFIDNIVGKIAAGTAGSFLTRPAGIGAIDGLAVNLVLGMPVSQVASYLGHEVVYEPKVRYALSFSIGQGIGSLFGDNIIGRLIGTVAGVPIAITLDITTGIERFYEWLSSGWATSPNIDPAAATALPNSSHYFQPVPAATDLYVMNAVVLDSRNASAARDAIDGDGRFTLTGLTVNDPDGDQPGSLDVMMAVEAAEQQDGDSPLALVAFRFPLDRLIPPAETAASALPDTLTTERVS